jgi:hypothetical protein
MISYSVTTARVSVAAEIRWWMVCRGGEARQGAEDHPARFAPFLRLDRDQLPGERVGVVPDARHNSAKVTLDTYADLFDTDLDAVAEALDLKCAHSVPKPRPVGRYRTVK